MRAQIFNDAIAEIFATFGRGVPTGTVRDTLFDRTRHIPDEAVPYIVERVCDLERLPQNMSREFRNAWADWRARHPARILRPDCPACRNTGVRHVWGQDEQGEWRHCVVPCPACQDGNDGVPVVSLRALERGGALVMPVNYPGGPVAFDRDNALGRLWPVGLDTASPRAQLRVGVDMRPDQRRVAHLPEQERPEHAAAMR